MQVEFGPLLESSQRGCLEELPLQLRSAKQGRSREHRRGVPDPDADSPDHSFVHLAWFSLPECRLSHRATVLAHMPPCWEGGRGGVEGEK
eukprot:1390110-Alexandrium_andersonii.AAC.1